MKSHFDIDATETLTITLSADLLAATRAAVARGDFPDVNWIVEQSLADRIFHSLETVAELDALRAKIASAIASGDPRPLDIEDVKRRGRERLAADRRRAA